MVVVLNLLLQAGILARRAGVVQLKDISCMPCISKYNPLLSYGLIPSTIVPYVNKKLHIWSAELKALPLQEGYIGINKLS